MERALAEYSSGDHYKDLLEAKNYYFSITGQATEEDDDFELRMSAFNDWYILQYHKDTTLPKILEFLELMSAEDKVKELFKNINHSLFEYCGLSFKKRHVFKDYIHDRKIKLDDENARVSFVKGDLFIGRMMMNNEESASFLFGGMCFFPTEVKSVLKKEAKKVRQMKSPKEETKFLLKLEALKTKWQRFGHVDPTKIFLFND